MTPGASERRLPPGWTPAVKNRVQELVEKNEQHAYDGAPLHFIGHLQKNKIKYLVGVADMIESVDSEELLTLIDRRAEKLGVTQDVLLEVNIGREEAKSGLAPEDVLKTVEFASPAGPCEGARGSWQYPL